MSEINKLNEETLEDVNGGAVSFSHVNFGAKIHGARQQKQVEESKTPGINKIGDEALENVNGGWGWDYYVNPTK